MKLVGGNLKDEAQGETCRKKEKNDRYIIIIIDLNCSFSNLLFKNKHRSIMLKEPLTVFPVQFSVKEYLIEN